MLSEIAITASMPQLYLSRVSQLRCSGKFTRRHVTVVMYDAAGTELMRWNFVNAYPVKWIGPQLLATDTAAAVETLELAHEGVALG